ncbi:MAG: hypothetical protein ABI185_02360 [Ginsengibacter sp.]
MRKVCKNEKEGVQNQKQEIVGEAKPSKVPEVQKKVLAEKLLRQII